VTTAPLTADELGRLVDSLLQRTSLIELAVVAGCLLLAWLTVRFMRSADTPSHSVWFGAHVIDGVLFPVLALVFAVAARWALKDVVPLVIFRLVVPVFTSLLVIRLTVRVLHNAFPTSKLMRVVERSVSWLAWIAVVLWILGVLPLVLGEMEAIRWRIGATQISLRDLIEGLLTGVIVLVIALWLSAAIEQKLLKDATDDLSVRKIAANAVRAAMLFIGLMFALSAAGIDLTALGVLGGALGVGIGFGLQKLAANYVSGFVILAERSVRIGDMVRIDNFEGRITDINTRYTVIRALNGRESIVPNEMLITQRVENSSLADRSVAASTTVQVAYGTDLETLMPRLAAAVSEVPRILRDPGPAVFLSAFASDGLELTVSFWIADPENGQLGPRSAANMVILRVLNDAGIEIPYPQRVLRRA
jgi:small-conductance mechanosensitive channel